MTIEHVGGSAEKTLLEEATRECPECLVPIDLEAGTTQGELFGCPDCGFELEAFFFDPKNEKEVKRIIKIAEDQGGTEERKYDVSHLNLTESPAFIPAPQLEEDHGE